MKSSQKWYFGIYIFITAIVGITTSQQLCPPPDVPFNGKYYSKDNKFQPGDLVTYECNKDFTLMGKETSKCKSNGDWSNPTPFCDAKARLKNPNIQGRHYSIPMVIDGNSSTCATLKTGESLIMTLEEKGAVYAVRIYLEAGTTNIEIRSGLITCGKYNKFIETRQWVLLQCNKNDVESNLIKIQDKSDRGNNSTLCEIEVYVKEEDGCEHPPDRRVANGYFQVTRSKAKLICEEGYRSENTRLICERNNWSGSRLQCNEILCDPVINVTKAPESEWIFLDVVRKISAGTRRQLKCGSGYKKIGGPDIVTCQKNGTWTKTNATCIEEAKPKVNTKTIIIGVVAALVVLIILSLLGTTIYFVRKQRNREVVVVYKQPADGSMISGSEGDYATAYYESIKSDAPIPPTTSRPAAQMITDEYFAPLDSKNSLKQQPMPVDIAFGTLKSSTLYNC